MLGGLVVGLLSTSYLGFLNLLCCASVWIGALVAVWHYTDTNELTLPAGQGAVLGILAGLFGFAISFVVNYILVAVLDIRSDLVVGQMILDRFSGSMPPEAYEEAVDKMNEPVTIVSYLKNSWTVILYVIFGAIGGAIGAAIFKKGGEAQAG